MCVVCCQQSILSPLQAQADQQAEHMRRMVEEKKRQRMAAEQLAKEQETPVVVEPHGKEAEPRGKWAELQEPPQLARRGDASVSMGDGVCVCVYLSWSVYDSLSLQKPHQSLCLRGPLKSRLLMTLRSHFDRGRSLLNRGRSLVASGGREEALYLYCRRGSWRHAAAAAVVSVCVCHCVMYAMQVEWVQGLMWCSQSGRGTSRPTQQPLTLFQLPSLMRWMPHLAM